MVLVGCRPKGRHTEQHDVFFGIGEHLEDIKPQLLAFWPNAGKIHIDAWRTVTAVNGYQIDVVPRNKKKAKTNQLFFLNLGGYKPAEMEEYHYKILEVATEKSKAIAAAKKTTFFKHTGFKGAESHIDDQYGVDVDDIMNVADILPAAIKKEWQLQIKPNKQLVEDVLHLGYLKWEKIGKTIAR